MQQKKLPLPQSNLGTYLKKTNYSDFIDIFNGLLPNVQWTTSHEARLGRVAMGLGGGEAGHPVQPIRALFANALSAGHK